MNLTPHKTTSSHSTTSSSSTRRPRRYSLEGLFRTGAAWNARCLSDCAVSGQRGSLFREVAVWIPISEGEAPYIPFTPGTVNTRTEAFPCWYFSSTVFLQSQNHHHPLLRGPRARSKSPSLTESRSTGGRGSGSGTATLLGTALVTRRGLRATGRCARRSWRWPGWYKFGRVSRQASSDM